MKVCNPKDINFWRSVAERTTNFAMWRDKFSEIAMSQIGWRGFPVRTKELPGVDIRFLEKLLYVHGKAVLLKDPVMQYVVMQCGDMNSGSKAIDIYDKPMRVLATANNGYHRVIPAKDCVIIYNNYNRTGNIEMVEAYAAKMAWLELLENQNLNTQRNPFFIKCSEKQRVALEAIFSQIMWAPAIFAPQKKDNSSILDNIEVLDLKCEMKTAEFQKAKKEVLNEFMTFCCGIPAAREQAEVVLNGQTNVDLGFAVSAKQSALDARMQAAEEIKEKFGLEVTPYFRSVNWYSSPDEEAEAAEENNDREDEE